MATTLACGHIVNDPNQTHYCDYLHLLTLIKLQPTADSVRHPDEHLFVIVHQSFELWFKQLRWDLARVIEALQDDNVTLATWLMRRSLSVVRLFAPTMQILDTMVPSDFYAFRAHLSPASGTESFQWHEVEILAGARESGLRRMLDNDLSGKYDEGTQAHLWTEELDRLWHAPSVASEVEALLARRGLSGADLYTVAPLHNPNGELMLLAEVLLDFDEEFRVWRFVHARTAERAIGSNPGTGHTTGVRYLDYNATHRAHFFPTLWEARAALWERVQTGAATGVKSEE